MVFVKWSYNRPQRWYQWIWLLLKTIAIPSSLMDVSPKFIAILFYLKGQLQQPFGDLGPNGSSGAPCWWRNVFPWFFKLVSRFFMFSGLFHGFSRKFHGFSWLCFVPWSISYQVTPVIACFGLVWHKWLFSSYLASNGWLPLKTIAIPSTPLNGPKKHRPFHCAISP